MGAIKAVLIDIANDLGHRGHIDADPVSVEYEFFMKKVMNTRSTCCDSPVKVVSYSILQCENCKMNFLKDELFNRSQD